MAVRYPVVVDSKTVTTSGTPEALTADEIECSSVYLVAAEGNSGSNVYVVDDSTDSKKVRVPSGGISLPITDPSTVRVDVDTDGDAVEWMAV